MGRQRVFITADLHLGHHRLCSHDFPGGKQRPFDSGEEMDEQLVLRWNSVVQPADKVYVLGDVAIKRQSIKLLFQMNGRKVLIKGNHDIFKLKDYAEHFKDIRAYHLLSGFVMSHVPIHPGSLRWGANVHGHLHHHKVDDNRYLNVCVEHTNYTPLSLEEVEWRLHGQMATP